MEDINNFFQFTMSHALLAIQNILQSSTIFNRSRETVLFTPFGDKKVTQFSGLLPTPVSYLKWFVLYFFKILMKIRIDHQCKENGTRNKSKL